MKTQLMRDPVYRRIRGACRFAAANIDLDEYAAFVTRTVYEARQTPQRQHYLARRKAS